MNTIVPLFLVGSSSNLQVTRIGIKSLMSSISSQIGLFASELLTLERRKFSPWAYGENGVGTIAPSFYWIFFSLAGNEERHKILDEFLWARPGELLLSYLPEQQTYSYRLIIEKMLWTQYRLHFVKLADNQNRHKISDTLEFLPDPTINFRVWVFWVLKNFPMHT